MRMDTKQDISKRAYDQLHTDAEKIRQLIQVQMDNLTMPQCPLYEEVLDTQMFGLSREVEFAIKLDLVDELEGRQLLDNLEQELSKLHDAYTKTSLK